MPTLLETVTKLCERQALAIPPTVMGSSDKQVIQIRSLLEESLDALIGRGVWEELTREASWTTTATEDQGALTTLAPDFKWLFIETLWDRTNRIPLLGPMTPRQWQQLKAMTLTGPRYQFRIRGGHFFSIPAPTAGLNWVFEYSMNCWAETTEGSASYIKEFDNDSNFILLPQDVVYADLRWRWKKEKGLTFAQDFESAEALINDAVGRSGSKPILSMDDPAGDAKPGIFIPQFNWPV